MPYFSMKQNIIIQSKKSKYCFQRVFFALSLLTGLWKDLANYTECREQNKGFLTNQTNKVVQYHHPLFLTSPWF